MNEKLEKYQSKMEKTMDSLDADLQVSVQGAPIPMS